MKYVVAVAIVIAAITANAQTPALVRADSLRYAHHYADAIKLIRTHLAEYPDDTHAQFMLGETLYWLGDFTAAARILAAQPDNAEARREVAEIRAASARWLKLSGAGVSDNQPIHRAQLRVDAGTYLNPLWALGLRVYGEHAISDSSIFSPLSATLDHVDARLTLHGYQPLLHTELDLSAGVVRAHDKTFNYSQTLFSPVGSVRVGFRLGNGLNWGTSFDRTRYSGTIASLHALRVGSPSVTIITPPFTEATLFTGKPFILNTIASKLRFDRSGWLGEAAVQRDQWPDVNHTSTVYGWLLGPVLRNDRAIVQVGYAYSFQNAEDSRFFGFGSASYYFPYFTPNHDRQHAVAGSILVGRNGKTTFQVNGSYGRAHRNMPLRNDPGPNGYVAVPVIYQPFQLHTALSAPFGYSHSFTLEAERLRTAFYQETRVSASLAFRFIARPRS